MSFPSRLLFRSVSLRSPTTPTFTHAPHTSPQWCRRLPMPPCNVAVSQYCNVSHSMSACNDPLIMLAINVSPCDTYYSHLSLQHKYLTPWYSPYQISPTTSAPHIISHNQNKLRLFNKTWFSVHGGIFHVKTLAWAVGLCSEFNCWQGPLLLM